MTVLPIWFETVPPDFDCSEGLLVYVHGRLSPT
jgi:hypothetical protein